MVKFFQYSGIACLLGQYLMGYVSAHPWEQHDHEELKREIQTRDAYAAHVARRLEKCTGSAEHHELQKRSIARRASAMESLRKERQVQTKKTYRRDEEDLKKWMAVNHNETLSIENDGPVDIFATNSTCVLTQQWSGPYWVQGELVRSHIAEDQPGIPTRMLMEFVDAHTCQPIPWLMVDIWMCNSTGKYSGVTPGENAGVNTTWLRGVQVTQADGTVEFDTIFPGYYEDRTNHVHVMTHSNSTLFRNGTYDSGKVQHIGQLYFDQDLIETIEATFPYNMNTANVTRNSIDLLTPTAASKDYDPFLKYAYVGGNLEDGLLTWISIAIDTSADYTNGSIPAAIWGQDGGRDSGLSIEFPSITAVPTGTEEPPRGSSETP